METSHNSAKEGLSKKFSSELLNDDTDIFSSEADYNISSQSKSFGKDDTSGPSATACPAYCPMCGVEIDGTWLIGWRLGKRSSYRHKKRFCLVHTRRSAKIEWRKRGYPEINWRSLKSRFRSFHPALNKVISEGVQGNKPKKPRLGIADQIPLATAGYYGPRGRDLMSDYIGFHFAQKIRDIAPKHTLIADVGVGSYILTVLVPELAVLLIRGRYEDS